MFTYNIPFAKLIGLRLTKWYFLALCSLNSSPIGDIRYGFYGILKHITFGFKIIMVRN